MATHVLPAHKVSRISVDHQIPPFSEMRWFSRDVYLGEFTEITEIDTITVIDPKLYLRLPAFLRILTILTSGYLRLSHFSENPGNLEKGVP